VREREILRKLFANHPCPLSNIGVKIENRGRLGVKEKQIFSSIYFL